MTTRAVKVRIDADLDGFNRGVLGASANTRKWVNELEAADSRLTGLVQTGLALAPALVPIGALAVPAIAGLATQLGFAAVAGGTALLAFQGVGDALGALNKFQLEPTSENLEKLTEKLDALGPAGEVFVRQLQEIRSEVQGLQDVAQENMLPGVTEGIESALTQMPRFERVIASVATALGDLTADAGADLAGPEWSEFFEYLDREAGPILEAMGKSLGNMFEGVTNMVMALDPLSDGFTSGMLEMTESFVAWSDGLDSSQGFQEFVRYIQESGPQAMDTLGAIASALVEFVEAAAPVGAVVLPVLEVLADVLGELADSPVGPVIIGAAAAVGTLGRSLALLSAVGLRGGAGDSLMGKVFAVDKIKAGVAAMQLGQQSLYNITTASERAAMGATKVAAATERQHVAEQKRTAAMKAGAVQMGKTAAAAGGLALMTSGVGDSMGASNAMSMALMGTLAGPWGAAVGGGVGLMMDFANAGDLAESMQTQLAASVRSAELDFEAMSAAVDAGADRLAEYADQQTFLGKSFEGWDWLLTGESAFDTITAKQREAEEQAASTRAAFAVVATAFGEDFKDSFGRSVLPTMDQLTLAAQRAAPAMAALGITAEDLASMDQSDLERASAAIANWTTNADTAKGRTEAVAAAMRELDGDMVQTATAAEMLKGSLDALLGPGMNLSAATDAWRDGLRNLNEELDRNKGSLFDNTDAASQNRGAIRGMVTTSTDLLVAQANAGASAKDLTRNMRGQREALIDAGAAAGISRGEMNKYLNTLGLTPKMISTLIKAETAGAMANINGFKFAWDSLKSKTIYLTTVETRSGAGGQRNGYDPSAYGNIFPTVASFAHGDVANGHQPELAGPGITRVWREPETQGEAYIPLANDSRRPRARSILEETASLLGARSVEWFANGGMTKKGPKRGLEQDGEGAVDMSWLIAVSEAQLEASTIQLRAARTAALAAEDQSEAADKALNAAQALYDGVQAQVASQFDIDPLARPDSAWAQGGDPFASLQSVIDGAGAFTTSSTALEGRGLDGAALAYGMESQSNLDRLSAMSDADLQKFEDMYNQATQAVATAATTGADLAYGQQVAAAVATSAKMEAQLQVANGTLGGIQQNIGDLSGRLAELAQQVGEAAAAGIVTGGNAVARRGRR